MTTSASSLEPPLASRPVTRWLCWVLANTLIMTALENYPHIPGLLQSHLWLSILRGLWPFAGFVVYFLPMVFVQWLLLRPVSDRWAAWTLISCLGGFVGSLASRRLTAGLGPMYRMTDDPFRLHAIEIAAALDRAIPFGIGLGAGQCLLLRQHLTKAWRWIIISTVSSTLSALVDWYFNYGR